ncbi:glucose transporter GlcU [Pediococcus damnosus]|uniref:GRP family sugar transporter n=1 Tax=Pediococcus damnosus TaxID=51663 RepID=UPI000C1C88C8|nr:GRP family sugar transporter [Pediococcus damnosus]PIO80874.1 glucose transporter GlcU [Pediococcus damnosus]
MGIIIALIPAIAWGSIGLVSGRLGGTAPQQTLGMTMGAIVFAIFTWFLYQPTLTSEVWVAGIVSGLFWAVGQGMQFTSMKKIGVSKTVPLSTGLQLAGNALAGVLIWHEWKTGKMITMGTVAVICLIVGATFTSLRDKNDKEHNKDEDMGAGIRALIISTIGYIGYTVIVRFANVNAKAVILPQAIGMFIGAVIFVVISKAAVTAFKNRHTWANMLTGIIWGVGNIFMFLAIPRVGLAISYSLAQAGIVISTFGSIWFLGEHKTHREMQYVVFGSALIIVGSTILGMMQ